MRTVQYSSKEGKQIATEEGEGVGKRGFKMPQDILCNLGAIMGISSAILILEHSSSLYNIIILGKFVI